MKVVFCFVILLSALVEAIPLTFPTSCAVLHILPGNNRRVLHIVLGKCRQSSNSFGWRIWDRFGG